MFSLNNQNGHAIKKLNQTQKKDSSQIQCVQQGIGLIQQTIKKSKGNIDDQLIQKIRVEYSKIKECQKVEKSKRKVEVSIFSNQYNNISSNNKNQQIQEVSIENQREYFYIGSKEQCSILLQDEQQGIQANIIFNDVCIQDQSICPMHLEVQYGHLFDNNNNYEQEFKQLKSIFRNLRNQNSFSDQTIRLILNNKYQNKKKLRISDQGNKCDQPVQIQIKQICENQILEEKQVFRIGITPQLIVKTIYQKLEYFFQQYSKNNQIKSKLESIFNALQSLPYLISFSGLEEQITQLFMKIQQRDITKQQFIELIENQNLMLQNKIVSILNKKCILINVQKDENVIQNFMLIADQKQVFSLGRMEYSDIIFVSIQISRSHGQIVYQEENNQWIIQDGIMNSQNEWQPSKFGIWLEMNPQQCYYIDSDQLIKITQNQILKLNLINDEHNQDDQVYDQLQQSIQKRSNEIDSFIEELIFQ